MGKLQASAAGRRPEPQEPAEPTEDDDDAAHTVGRWHEQRDAADPPGSRPSYFEPWPESAGTAQRLWYLCRRPQEGGYVRTDVAEAVVWLDSWGFPQDLRIQALEDVRALDREHAAGVNEERKRWSDD